MAERALERINTWAKTNTFVESSIKNGTLPAEAVLPRLSSFEDECAHLALGQEIFRRNGIATESVFVPRNLTMKTWRELFAAKLSPESRLRDIQATNTMTVDRESLLAGLSWSIALVSSGETPLFDGWDTAKILRKEKAEPCVDELAQGYVAEAQSVERVVKSLSPSLETYLALQLKRAICGEELVDEARDQRTIGRATLLAEDLVGVNIKEEAAIRSLCAGSNTMYQPHRIWLGSKTLHSLTQEIGFRPTINPKSKHPA